MSEKSQKADRKRKARSNVSYVSGGRRYLNKLKAVKRHCLAHPKDIANAAWLKFLSTVFSIDYKRGAVTIRAAHERIFNGRG